MPHADSDGFRFLSESKAPLRFLTEKFVLLNLGVPKSRDCGALKIVNFSKNLMDGYPKLDFPAPHLRVKRDADGSLRVWDSLRGRYLLLTPEEWVRRHLIAWLIGRGVPERSICQEYPVDMSGAAQRADVVVMDGRGEPLLLAECKAAEVSIDASVLSQAVRYNSVLGARFVMLTNGIAHYVYEYVGARYVPLRSLPELF